MAGHIAAIVIGVNDFDVIRYVDDDILETKSFEGGILNEADLVASSAHFGVLGGMNPQIYTGRIDPELS